MVFLHGTNSLALRQIIEDGFIKPLSMTKKQNICQFTTTMQDNAIYLTSEKMIASFYTPRRKRNIDGINIYSCILEIEIPYDRRSFRPDEDYMNDILSYTDYKLYDKYLTDDYEKYIDSMKRLIKKNLSKKDVDFRYLFSLNEELGNTILSEADPLLSLELGCVAYIEQIPIEWIKSITISDIFETTTQDITLDGIRKAIDKVDFRLDEIIFDDSTEIAI